MPTGRCPHCAMLISMPEGFAGVCPGCTRPIRAQAPSSPLPPPIVLDRPDAQSRGARRKRARQLPFLGRILILVAGLFFLVVTTALIIVQRKWSAATVSNEPARGSSKVAAGSDENSQREHTAKASPAVEQRALESWRDLVRQIRKREVLARLAEVNGAKGGYPDMVLNRFAFDYQSDDLTRNPDSLSKPLVGEIVYRLIVDMRDPRTGETYRINAQQRFIHHWNGTEWIPFGVYVKPENRVEETLIEASKFSPIDDYLIRNGSQDFIKAVTEQ